MDLSEVAKYKAAKELKTVKMGSPEGVVKVAKDQVTNFSKLGKLDLKKLRGMPCDPEKSLMMTIYSERTKKMRQQLLKRCNIIDRLCFYQSKNKKSGMGKIVAFVAATGQFVLVVKDPNLVPDMEDPKIVLLERR